MRVTVIGAGLMGAQIGVEYALAGHDVTLVVRDVDGVSHRLRRALDLVDREGLAPGSAIARAASGIALADELTADALACELAVESLPERLDLKVELLRRVAEAEPSAILASNTSSIPISTLGEAIGAPGRVIGTHYLNPPLLMPTVEVIPGSGTSDAVTRRVVALLTELGKLPIVVARDVPGFIWNRLQFALLRECAWLVDNGVASTEDVDLVLREGLARRWRRVGPFAAMALGGMETWTRSAANLVPELSATNDLGDLTRFAEADPEELQRLLAARDAALAAELREERDR